MLARGIGRRGPGLLGTVARTAVISGTATAVSNNVSRRQQGRAVQAAEASAVPPPPPPPVPAQAAAEAPRPTGQELIDQLAQLGALKEQGILTEAEFDAQKARLLGG